MNDHWIVHHFFTGKDRTVFAAASHPRTMVNNARLAGRNLSVDLRGNFDRYSADGDGRRGKHAPSLAFLTG
jgi:hypothetical protein